MTIAGGAFEKADSDNSELAAFEHRKIYEFIGSFCKGRILEAACGAGYGSDFLKGEELVGIDVEQENLDRAVGYSRLIKADLEGKIGLPTGYFDTIVSQDTIEHLHNQKGFLAELHRLLKDGGTLIIGTPNKEVTIGVNTTHVKELSREEFTHLLKEAGFEIIGFCGITLRVDNRERVAIPTSMLKENKIIRIRLFAEFLVQRKPTQVEPFTNHFNMIAVCKKGISTGQL